MHRFALAAAVGSRIQTAAQHDETIMVLGLAIVRDPVRQQSRRIHSD